MKKILKKSIISTKIKIYFKYKYFLNILKILKFKFFSLNFFKLKKKKKNSKIKFFKIYIKKLKNFKKYITIFSFKKYQVKIAILNILFITKLTYTMGFILSILKKKKKFLRRSEKNNYYFLFFLKRYLSSIIFNSQSVFFYTFKYKFLKLMKKIISQRYLKKKKICLIQKKNINKFNFKRYRSIKKRIRKLLK